MKQVLTDPTLEKHLCGHESRITGLIFDPSSKQLVSSSADRSLMVWNLKDKTRAFKFIGHSDIVSDVCYSPAGQLIASCSYDQKIRLWTPKLGGTCGEFRAHAKSVQSVHFSHDGLTLLTASNDKTVKDWSVQKKTHLSTFTGHNDWVRCARFSHDSKTIITASDDKSIKLFDRRKRDCIHTFSESRVPQKVVFHPSASCFAAAFKNKTVKLYDLRILKQLQMYQCHEGDVFSVDFHPNGNYLFTVAHDGIAKIIDLLEGRTVYTLEGNRGPLTAVCSSADGNYFAFGSLDGQILLWKANFDEVLQRENDFDSFLDSEKSSNLIGKAFYDEVEDLATENKENINIDCNSSNSSISFVKSDSEGSNLNVEEYFKSLSSRLDVIAEVTNRMRDKLMDLDERCKRLENLHIDSV